MMVQAEEQSRDQNTSESLFQWSFITVFKNFLHNFRGKKALNFCVSSSVRQH